MVKCSFCGNEIPTGRGIMFVRTNGEILYFCNSKCERNWKLGRDPKKVKWTQTYRKFRKE